MALFSAFFRLIRWPNLVFIALTQALFYFFVILLSFHQFLGANDEHLLRLPLFVCLTVSSVLIAA
ncbi:MAG TPA: ubiquinone biosynthesis protein UbiA, partial [Puia sp.]|nr:ubiquinone biosynthesis protein UbiA [Puia sp.]